MTPLAHRIVKELTLPVKRRTFKDRVGLLPRMSDIHCFDLSEVMEVIDALSDDIERRPGSADALAFLPAPKTWLEWKADGARFAVLLEETKFGADITVVTSDVGSTARARIALRDTLTSLEPDDIAFYDQGYWPPEERVYITNLIYAALALINTPRIIGRRQHMPHRGLERDLARAKKTVGKFPLHAWTEIKLEITTPYDASGEPSAEAHYTGDRARHFCRAHLRIRLGKVEIVRGHWRGNKSFGIKQSRYRLTSKSKEEYVS